jgi:ubiquinone/menaquinone biosynthesis C-methylase UbiE
MNKQTADILIDKTRDDYNLIAEHFASTRRFNWGDFSTALKSIPIEKGAKVLDLGCGNGRVYDLLKDLDVDYSGLDLSSELVEFAKKNVPGGHFNVGSLLETPYADNEFDLVICVATLHHIPSKAARKQAIEEIYRITKTGGYALITNWYFWNQLFFLKQILRTYLDILLGKSDLDPGDFLMNWKRGNGKTITDRYFHAWGKIETANVLRKAGFKVIRNSLYKKRSNKAGNNLIAIAQKPNKSE